MTLFSYYIAHSCYMTVVSQFLNSCLFNIVETGLHMKYFSGNAQFIVHPKQSRETQPSHGPVPKSMSTELSEDSPTSPGVQQYDKEGYVLILYPNVQASCIVCYFVRRDRGVSFQTETSPPTIFADGLFVLRPSLIGPCMNQSASLQLCSLRSRNKIFYCGIPFQMPETKIL